MRMAPFWVFSLPLAVALWLSNVKSAAAIISEVPLTAQTPPQLQSRLLMADALSTYVHRQTDGYFGFAVAAYVDQEIPYVTVGAPRDRVASWRDEGDDRRIGRGYRCGQRLGEAWSCEPTPAATRSSQRDEYRALGHVEPSARESQWMGASVAATSVGRDGYFATCAPRFVSKSTVHAGQMWAAIGECLLYPGLSHNYHVISPCNLTGAAAAAGRGADLGQCLSGFSSSVLGYQDGSDSVLYFAASLPGCYDSNGELFVGRFVNRNYTGGWNYHRQSGVERLLTGRSRSQYLGYNLRLVNLRTQAPPQQQQQPAGQRRAPPLVDLLASRPVWAEADWKGAVTVMNIFMTSELHVKDTWGRIGDYFGYSLAAADLDGDGVGDVIIGAPFHSNSSESRVNSGRVYVYYGRYTEDRYSVHPEPTVLQTAAWKTGHFGHSVAAIGDVDDDGLEDLAVGCPYCGAARSGEVHVYLSRRGRRLRTEPHQVLRAENHPLDTGGSLRQFGWSLSGGVDFDGNGYPDLVIGSHSSAAITLYKTRPLVRFSVSPGDLRAPALVDARKCSSDSSGSEDCRLRLGGSFRMSCSSRAATGLGELEVDMELDLDSRTPVGKRLRSVKLNSSVTVSRVRLRCNESYTFQDVAEIMPAPAQADLVTPIVARLRLQQAWPQDRANAPALHPDSDNTADFPRVEVLKPECGADNVCRPVIRLRLTGTGDAGGGGIEGGMDGVIIYGDQRTLLRLAATVENSGEAAHEPVLRFRLPNKVVVQWPVEATVAGEEDREGTAAVGASGGLAAGVRCSEDADASNATGRVLVCLLGRQLPPLSPDRALTISVTLLLDGFLQSGEGGNFTVVTDVSCQESASALASASFAVFVKADLQLAGAADRDAVMDTRAEAVAPQAGKRYRVETLGVPFNHSYELLNSGPSPLHNIEVNLTVPLETESGATLVYLLDRLTRVTVEGLRETFKAAPRVLEAGADREKVGTGCSFVGLNRLNLTLWRDEGRPIREKRAAAEPPASEVKAKARASLFGGGADGAGQSALEPVQCDGNSGRSSEAFGRVRCAVVTCRIGRLRAMEKVRIVFDGLLWARTLFDYQVPAVHLRTSAAAAAGSPPYGLRAIDRGGSSTMIVTAVEQFFFFKGVKPRPAYKAPMWVILVAVLVGLLLLAAIIAGLWRCGFFQRRRWFVDKPVQL